MTKADRLKEFGVIRKEAVRKTILRDLFQRLCKFLSKTNLPLLLPRFNIPHTPGLGDDSYVL